jgi:hypothetical protein
MHLVITFREDGVKLPIDVAAFSIVGDVLMIRFLSPQSTPVCYSMASIARLEVSC